MRPVTVVAPPGTLVAARPPAAVGAGNVEVSQRVADVCLGALAQAVPRPGRRRRPGHDEQRPHRRRRLGLLRDHRRRAGRPPGPPAGMSGVHTGDDQHAGTRPSRRWSGRSRCGCGATGCGGAAAAPGSAPGGEGIERDLEVLEDCTVSLITERRRQPAVGPGRRRARARSGENWLLPGGDESRAERLARQVHGSAAGRRRPADADPRRRRLGHTEVSGYDDPLWR